MQTGHFAADVKVRRENVRVREEFLAAHGAPRAHPAKGRPQAWLWRDVPAERLCAELLARFQVHPRCLRLDTGRVREFIRRQTAQGELVLWTVALVSNSQAVKLRKIAGVEVGLAERAPADEEELARGVYSVTKANIQSPSHQAFDLAQLTLDEVLLGELLGKEHRGGKRVFGSEDEAVLRRFLDGPLDAVPMPLTQARARRLEEPERPNGRIIRELRPVSRGLLLVYALAPEVEKLGDGEPPYLGLALSFPSSHTARSVSYEANEVLINQLRDGDFEDL